MCYNKETLKKMQQPSDAHPEMSSQLSKMQESSGQLSLRSTSKDSEFPMPPLALAPSHQQGIRYLVFKKYAFFLMVWCLLFYFFMLLTYM